MKGCAGRGNEGGGRMGDYFKTDGRKLENLTNTRGRGYPSLANGGKKVWRSTTLM